MGSIRIYGYDASGNMISRYGQRLDYDPESRLTRVTSLTSTNTFGYDGDDERLWKQGPNGLQVWIGAYEEKQGKVLFHVIAGGQKVCTFDATGTNVFEYYHSDHLHSTSILTDQSGNRVQHHEYSAYGRDRYTESLTAFPVSHRFTGQVLDEDTGLYYYNARYYDPELARFTQPDTIIPGFGIPQSLNRYSYVYNNPLKYNDPTGHLPLDQTFAFMARISGSSELDQAAKRLGERSGRGWQTYKEAACDLGIDKGMTTSGNQSAIQGVAGLTGELGVEFEFYYTPQGYPPDPSGDHLSSPAHA